MELMLQGITKLYGPRAALQNVFLHIAPGIIAVMGPNGSGKTTLLRCLGSLVQPDQGQLWFDGWDYRKNVSALRRRVGYLPQELDLPVHLTPRRLLTYLATLKNATADDPVDRLLEALSLGKIADTPFSKLSSGQTRLVGIAQAFLGQPDLLLLDELTRGLDVEERAKVFALIRKPAPGRLLLYSTHHPTDAEQLADGIIILRKGEVIFSGEVGKLYQKAQAVPHFIDTSDQGSDQESEAIDRKDGAIREMGPQSIPLSKSNFQNTPLELTIEEAYLRLLREPYNVRNC